MNGNLHMKICSASLVISEMPLGSEEDTTTQTLERLKLKFCKYHMLAGMCRNWGCKMVQLFFLKNRLADFCENQHTLTI